MLSSKPASGAYPSQYEKVTAYVRILSHPAMALDPTATATPGAAFQEVEDDLPFNYRDTATSRAGLAQLNTAFSGQHLTIVGLGGTGGYVLDQVAKTPVDQHPAHRRRRLRQPQRLPGARSATLEQLQQRPTRSTTSRTMYGNMHTGITAEAVLHHRRQPVAARRRHLRVPVHGRRDREAPDRDTPAGPGHPVHRRRHGCRGDRRQALRPPPRDLRRRRRGRLRTLARLPAPAEERDDYDRNIQVADLNALNAQLAVGRWKRHLGFYADATAEHISTYSIFTNDIVNERLDDEDDEQAAAS